MYFQVRPTFIREFRLYRPVRVKWNATEVSVARRAPSSADRQRVCPFSTLRNFSGPFPKFTLRKIDRSFRSSAVRRDGIPFDSPVTRILDIRLTRPPILSRRRYSRAVCARVYFSLYYDIRFYFSTSGSLGRARTNVHASPRLFSTSRFSSPLAFAHSTARRDDLEDDFRMRPRRRRPVVEGRPVWFQG